MVNLHKNRNKIKVIGGTLGVFLLLTFLIFPWMKSLTKTEKYIPGTIIESNNSLEAEVLFNNIQGEKPFTKRLISEIALATSTIDIAMYSIDSTEIRDALYSAANRGVKIQFVSDSKKHDEHAELLENLPENFHFTDVPEKRKKSTQPYMHNKFAIIDTGLKTEKLLTGAWNWTVIQEQTDPTYLFITSDHEIVSSYEEEFQRLFNGIHSKSKLSEKNYKPFNKLIKYKDSSLEIWFSPGIGTNSIQERILDMITESNSTIDIIIWQFTDIKIAKELLNAAKRGVYINIITDDTKVDTQGSAITFLQKQILVNKIKNINLYTDKDRTITVEGLENINSFIHHHFLITDNTNIAFGTNNWGARGAFTNDENTIITNDKKIIREFTKAFKTQLSDLKNNYINL